MRVGYNSIYKTYTVEGRKVFKEGDNASESNISFLIEPKMPSLPTNFQKRKFRRTIKASNKKESVFDSFVRESALIMQEYELEFNSKGVPYLLINHKEIWKRWLYYIDILNSRYSGQWVEKEISTMTCKIADEKMFLNILLNDFIINELYMRKIHTIRFDSKTNISNRKWIESALGIPLEFTQECKLLITEKKDSLTINGLADLSANKLILAKFCKKRSFDLNDIKSITQDTVYYSSYLAYTPERIESKFVINSKDSILRQVDININVKEVKEL